MQEKFLPDDFLHRHIPDLTFQPGNNIQVYKSAGLKTVLLICFQFFQEVTKFRFQFFGRKGKRFSQEPEDFFLHQAQVFHSGHKTVNGLDQVFEQIVVSQFVMGNQVQQSRIALQIRAQIHFPVDDLIEVFNRFFIVPASEIQGGKLVIKNEDPVSVEV